MILSKYINLFFGLNFVSKIRQELWHKFIMIAKIYYNGNINIENYQQFTFSKSSKNNSIVVLISSSHQTLQIFHLWFNTTNCPLLLQSA